MSSEIAIKVENLSKCYQIYEKPHHRLMQMFAGDKKQYYKEFWALKDVSFEVKKGETVGIIGRNGSGKSTLLQMICGTLNPSSGSIQTNGRIAALLELGSGFNPEFTGRENVYMNGAVLGLSHKEIDARFDDIAAFADIGDFIEQPVKTYSSGMFIRLAFSIQTQVEPDILIIDEALAVGDFLFQKRCFQCINKLTNNGTTFLFVSHDQESVRTLTQKSIFLNSGKIISIGNSSDVLFSYRKYLNEEEFKYFSKITKTVENDNKLLTKTTKNNRSDKKLSFGNNLAQIIDVMVLNSLNQLASTFYPKDKIIIRVLYKTLIDTKHLNVSLRIRNKEGFKIYSWGTLNQDMESRFHEKNTSVFWERFHLAEKEFFVDFNFDISLGVNLYEIQAAISLEHTFDYQNQEILNWFDEAAFFQVLMKKEEYFFGGSNDLKMKAKWSE